MKALSTLPRLFLEGAPLARAAPATTVPLPRPAAHYLSTVLRLRPGDAVRVFDGAGGEWLAEVAGAAGGGKRAGATTLRLTSQLRRQSGGDDDSAPPACTMWLLYAPLRASRMQTLVEKAVELGAGALLPVSSTRTQHIERVASAADASACSDDPLSRAVALDHAANGRHLRLLVQPDKLRTWAVEAAEQSERLSLPWLPPPVALSRLLSAWFWPLPRDAALATAATAGAPDGAAAAEAAAEAALRQALNGTDGRSVDVSDGGEVAGSPPPHHRLLVACDEALAPVRVAGGGSASVTPSVTDTDGAESAAAAAAHAATPSVYGVVRAWRAGLPPSARPPLVGVLVGPEGGWTDQERDAFDVLGRAAAAHASYGELKASGHAAPLPQQCAIVRASLGGWAGLLRAETAAGAALALAQQAAADGAADAAARLGAGAAAEWGREAGSTRAPRLV
jgi:16S rRNA (uracil1498-N3)-methyltransferase